jgi:hypothetical protein
VAAHTDIADIIEVDDSGSARWIVRLTEKRADDGIRGAWLVGDSGAKVIEVAFESVAPFGKRTEAQIRPARDDYTGGLTAGM